MLYLLEIFDGKLSIDDIQNMELKLLIEMKNMQEEKLEKEARRMAKLQKNQASSKRSPDTYDGIPDHIQALFGS